MARGFTQLAVELIALDQWTNDTAPILYGAVTTGDTWKFGTFHRQERRVSKDINTYAIPNDLDRILAFYIAMTKRSLVFLRIPRETCLPIQLP